MKFLTDVVNLPLAWAGLVTTVAVVWDAITDPIMGVITDRTRSKYGKHRRYILWGMPLFVTSFAMMFNSYGLDGENDGLVGESSFAWGEKYTLLRSKGTRGISHGDVIDLNRENIRDFDVRAFYSELVSDLRNRGL